MTTSPELENLVRIGQLKAERPSRTEFDALVASGEARLTDARRQDLSLASRFDLAYNAAHALSLAAPRLCGNRSENRYVVFQSLPHTLGLPVALWRTLATAHSHRNLAEYTGAFDIGERLVNDMIDAAGEVLERVKASEPPQRNG